MWRLHPHLERSERSLEPKRALKVPNRFGIEYVAPTFTIDERKLPQIAGGRYRGVYMTVYAPRQAARVLAEK
jgi:hypothetical protein